MGKSYGIEVARLAGLPNKVIEDARDRLRLMESRRLSQRPKSLDRTSLELNL